MSDKNYLTNRRVQSAQAELQAAIAKYMTVRGEEFEEFGGLDRFTEGWSAVVSVVGETEEEVCHRSIPVGNGMMKMAAIDTTSEGRETVMRDAIADAPIHVAVTMSLTSLLGPLRNKANEQGIETRTRAIMWRALDGGKGAEEIKELLG